MIFPLLRFWRYTPWGWLAAFVWNCCELMRARLSVCTCAVRLGCRLQRKAQLMPKGGDNRTITEKIADLLADGLTSNEIAAQLMIPYPQVRSRYLVICHALGEKPDAE
jgi:hypothetical protein